MRRNKEEKKKFSTTTTIINVNDGVYFLSISFEVSFSAHFVFQLSLLIENIPDFCQLFYLGPSSFQITVNWTKNPQFYLSSNLTSYVIVYNLCEKLTFLIVDSFGLKLASPGSKFQGQRRILIKDQTSSSKNLH